MTYETTFLEVRKEWKQGEKAGEGGVDPVPCSKVNFSFAIKWSVRKNFTFGQHSPIFFNCRTAMLDLLVIKINGKCRGPNIVFEYIVVRNNIMARVYLCINQCIQTNKSRQSLTVKVRQG